MQSSRISHPTISPCRRPKHKKKPKPFPREFAAKFIRNNLFAQKHHIRRLYEKKLFISPYAIARVLGKFCVPNDVYSENVYICGRDQGEYKWMSGFTGAISGKFQNQIQPG